MAELVTILLVLLIPVAYAVVGLRVVQEHEQGLVSRFGTHYAVIGPGLHLLIPLVDRLQRVDLRQLAVAKAIDPGAGGRIRIGAEEWDARTDGGQTIGPGTPIRITRVDGAVMVVEAA